MGVDLSYLPIVLKAFAVMLIAASLLPLVPTNLGFIRTLDFPRFQFAIALLACIVGLLSLERDAGVLILALERLTEPFDLVEGDEACGEAGEGLVDVAAPLVADGQATEAVEPSVGPLDDPAVTPEPLAALDAFAGDARYDPARPTLLAPRPGIVGLVCVQLAGPPAWSPAPSISQGRDGVEGLGHHHAVVPVGPAQAEAERRAARIGDEVALRTRLAPVRRVRAGGRAPFLAGTDALSRLARLQSISPAACRRSSRT